MSSIKHISIDLFENRVCFTKSEQAHPQGKVGIREYTDPFICFFAALFGFAVNVTYKGQIFCLNKNSFREWLERNLENDRRLTSIETLGAKLIEKVDLSHRFRRIKAEIRQLDDVPDFVERLCQEPPTPEVYQELKSWRKAWDIVTVWTVLANEIDRQIPEQDNFDTLKGWISASQEFTSWFDKNKEELSAISILKFSDLSLKELPKEIGKLENLEDLWLSRNNLKELPEELCGLKNLKVLELSGNPLKKFPEQILGFEKLWYLMLDNTQLTELPKEVCKLKNLQRLSLSGNKLNKLPAEIFGLKKLKHLFLADINLEEIPKEIGNLKKLLVLELSGNQLKIIPKELFELKELVHLKLSKNQLEALPKEIGKLKKLTKLSLSENQLKKLPIELFDLKCLECLSLSGIQLKKLSKEIGKLTNLVYLDLSENELKNLPEELIELTNLIYFYINNPLLADLSVISQLKENGVKVQ